MTLFKVIKPVEIKKGFIVELSTDQAMPRLHDLKPRKKGQYEVKNDVSFKAGEVIGIDPAASKAFLDAMEPVEVRAGRK